MAFAVSSLAGLTPAAAESLPANASTAYSAVIHFDRIDYVVENRFGPSTPTAAVAGLETAIVFNQGAMMEPDATGHMALPANFADRVAFVAGAAPNAKLTLGVFSLTKIAGKPTAIQTFIGELQSLITTYGFGGIDFDWEDMPNVSAVTPTIYGQTIKAISDVLRPQGIVISTSHAQGSQYRPYAAAVANVVDFVNLQFYFAQTNALDMPTFKSNLAGYVNLGLEASQIRIGLPSYGMVANGTPTTDKWRSWNNLRNAGVDLTAANQWTDPSNGLTYYFSGLNLIESKVRYAMANGFGGVFTWELTQDTDFANPLSINHRIDDLAAEMPLLELNNGNGGNGALGTGVVHLGSGNVLNDGILRFARDGANIYGNKIEGSGRVETTGTGTTILTGANTYSGGTRVAAGSRLNVGNGGIIGSVAGPVEVNGTLAINRSDDVTFTNALTGSGTLVKSGAGLLSLGMDALPATLTTFSISGGSVNNTGDLTFPGNVLIGDAYTGTMTQETGTVTFITPFANWETGVNIAHRIGGIGRYDLRGGTLQVPNAPIILASGPSNGTLAISGGTANLRGIAIGTSGTGTGRILLTGGRLNIGTDGIHNWTPVLAGAIRDIQLGAATLGATADWTSALAITLTDSAQGLTIATGDAASPAVARHISLGGPISGDGKLTLAGPGSLTLSGVSTYSGDTTIADTATLAGSGTIASAIFVQSGATLAPFAGATLTTGALTLASGSKLLADGALAVTGNVALTGAKLVVSTAPAASPRVLLTFTGARTGQFADVAIPAGWGIEYDDVAHEVRLVAAPGGYDAWIAGFETNGQSGFTDDADNDGTSNGLEFLLGGDPLVSGDTALPIFEKLPISGFRYSFTRTTRALGHVTVIAHLSDDMLTWPAARDIVVGVDTGASGPGVTITHQDDHDEISIEVSGDAQRTLIRLEVGGS